MAKERTSLWIKKLSNSGKELMHEFLKYFNTKNEPIKKLNLVLSQKDIEALSIIFSRLQKQKSIDEINQAINVFNKLYETTISLIKD